MSESDPREFRSFDNKRFRNILCEFTVRVESKANTTGLKEDDSLVRLSSCRKSKTIAIKTQRAFQVLHAQSDDADSRLHNVQKCTRNFASEAIGAWEAPGKRGRSNFFESQKGDSPGTVTIRLPTAITSPSPRRVSWRLRGSSHLHARGRAFR